MRETSWGKPDLLQARLAFARLVDAVRGDWTLEALHQAAAGPADLEEVHRCRGAKAQVRARAVRAEAAAAADGAVDLAAAAILGDVEAQEGPDRQAIGLLAREAQLDPAVLL